MEHVNVWCFRDIYKGGLWEDDLYVFVHLYIGYMPDVAFANISFKAVTYEL